MQAELIAAVVDGAIPFLGGVYATLLGFRVVGKKQGESAKYDEWHGRYGRLMKVIGPFLVVFGVFLVVTGMMRSPALSAPEPASWHRHRSSDDVVSAEFPRPPKQDVATAAGSQSHRLTVYLTEQDIYYMLTFSELGDEVASLTTEERLDAIRDGISIHSAQQGKKFELVSEQRIVERDVRGRRLEYEVDDTHIFQTKIFVLGKRLYRVIAVTPKEREAGEDTERFLASFRFESGKP